MSAIAVSRRPSIASFLWRVSIVAIYVFLSLPTVIVVLASVNAGEYLTFPPQGLSFRWYVALVHSQPFMSSLFLSVKVAAITCVMSTIIGTAAALFVVRHAGASKRYLRMLIIAPFLLPETMTAIALLLFLQVIGGWGNSLAGLLIGHVLITLPVAFLSVVALLENFDMNLELAAASLGASKWRIFRRITYPLILPGIVSGAVFSFIVSFDAFAISLLLKSIGSPTLPIQLYEYIRWDFDPTAAAISSIGVAVTVVAMILLNHLGGLRSVRF